MEDLPTDLKEESLRCEEDDNEFYEQIEAPKFVDFTVPDRSRSNYDSSWFCVRIGCDQKHEEIDPDALYRSFVLRVMAARSPNLRLRKALSRKDPSVLSKCPRSAPAKSSKSRISRLSALAPIPQKISENRVKVSLLSKLKSTPTTNGKVNQSSVTAKALTTPRNKKCQPNPEPFHSVQNPKVPTVVPKNKMVARALAFQTPKKSGNTTSFKSHNVPTLDVCTEMEKLEICSQTKKAPRHFCKSSRCAAYDLNHVQSTSSPTKSLLCARKLHRNRIEVPSKYLKKISKPNVQRCHSSVPQEGIDDDSSDMEIDGKSRNGSLEVCAVSNGHEKALKDATSVKLEVTNTTDESLPSSEESSIREDSLSNSEKDFNEDCAFKHIVVDDTKTLQSSDKENVMDNTYVGFTNTTEEESSLSSSDEYHTSENSLSNSKEKVVLQKDPAFRNSRGKEDQTKNLESADKENVSEETTAGVVLVKIESLPSSEASNGVVDEIEPVEIADKENATASDENRRMNPTIHNSERKICKHRVCENPLKVTEVPVKTLTENSATATGAQGGKYKKSKPTNPKPFRLRTDERGILKEANLERRMHLLDTSKESTPVSRFPNGTPLKRQPSRNEIHQNEKSHGQESSQGEPNRTVQKAQIQQKRSAYHKLSRYAEPKTPVRTPLRQKLEDVKEKVVTPKIKGTSKSPSLRHQLVRPQRGLALQGKLAVIDETSTISRTKEAPPCETQADKNTTATSRSSSRGKRPATVPKEPNFHSMHVPKSCTKTAATVIS